MPTTSNPANSLVVCVSCGHPIAHLYREYSKGNIRLSRCRKCRSIADPYVEFESVLLFIDMMLHKVSVYRHLLINRPQHALHRGNSAAAAGLPAAWKLIVVFLVLDVYTRLYLHTISKQMPSLQPHVWLPIISPYTQITTMMTAVTRKASAAVGNNNGAAAIIEDSASGRSSSEGSNNVIKTAAAASTTSSSSSSSSSSSAWDNNDGYATVTASLHLDLWDQHNSLAYVRERSKELASKQVLLAASYSLAGNCTGLLLPAAAPPAADETAGGASTGNSSRGTNGTVLLQGGADSNGNASSRASSSSSTSSSLSALSAVVFPTTLTSSPPPAPLMPPGGTASHCVGFACVTTTCGRPLTTKEIEGKEGSNGDDLSSSSSPLSSLSPSLLESFTVEEEFRCAGSGCTYKIRMQPQQQQQPRRPLSPVSSSSSSSSSSSLPSSLRPVTAAPAASTTTTTTTTTTVSAGVLDLSAIDRSSMTLEQRFAVEQLADIGDAVWQLPDLPKTVGSFAMLSVVELVCYLLGVLVALRVFKTLSRSRLRIDASTGLPRTPPPRSRRSIIATTTTTSTVAAGASGSAAAVIVSGSNAAPAAAAAAGQGGLTPSAAGFTPASSSTAGAEEAVAAVVASRPRLHRSISTGNALAVEAVRRQTQMEEEELRRENEKKQQQQQQQQQQKRASMTMTATATVGSASGASNNNNGNTGSAPSSAALTDGSVKSAGSQFSLVGSNSNTTVLPSSQSATASSTPASVSNNASNTNTNARPSAAATPTGLTSRSPFAYGPPAVRQAQAAAAAAGLQASPLPAAAVSHRGGGADGTVVAGVGADVGVGAGGGSGSLMTASALYFRSLWRSASSFLFPPKRAVIDASPPTRDEYWTTATSLLFASFARMFVSLSMVWNYPVSFLRMLSLFTFTSHATALQALCDCSMVEAAVLVASGYVASIFARFLCLASGVVDSVPSYFF